MAKEKKEKKLGAGEEEAVDTGTTASTGENITPKTSEKVTAADLAKVNDNIAQLLAVIQQAQADNEILKRTIQEERDRGTELEQKLEFIADKGRLGQWDQKALASGSLERNYKVATFKDKIVVGWTAMKTNLVYKNEHKAYVENQTTNLIYEDQSQEEVQYSFWQANRVMIDTLCEGEELLKDGSRLLKLVTKDGGKKLTIDAKFVN